MVYAMQVITYPTSNVASHTDIEEVRLRELTLHGVIEHIKDEFDVTVKPEDITIDEASVEYVRYSTMVPTEFNAEMAVSLIGQRRDYQG